MGRKMDLNHKCVCSSSGSVASVTSSSSRSSNGVQDKQGLRTVHLRRQCGMYLEGNGKAGDKLYPNVKPNNFGFSFRGGKEFGTGFFVSVVEKDSEAQYKGLRVGDQIVRINGLPVEDATHREVLQLAQSHHQLSLTVKSVGIIPVKEKPDDPVTWKVVESGTESQQIVAFGCDVDRVLIEIPENTQLGCGICKGPDWRPGIFVQYTKPNSLARRCGLQPGDQVLQCNRISFLQIDFAYAVSILKNARTLDLVLKKGSGLDLFPGESSGYSSSSSVADEAVSQPPFKPKRLSIVSEEGDERSFRKSCQRQSAKSNLKSSGSIDSIFDNLTNGTSAYREKSKSIEILTDTNAKKTVTFQNEGNVSKTLINFTKPLPDSCRFIGSGQTLIQNDKVEPSKVEKQTGNGMISMERTEHNSKRTTPNDAGLNSGSFSSSCSLSSAISQEIQKRNERRLKGNNSKLEKTEVVKMVNRQQKHQHDLLIAELKKKQGFDEKMTAGDFHIKDLPAQVTQKRVPEVEARKERVEIKTNGLSSSPVSNSISSPPSCPTPDYCSDVSLTDQSIESSHTVKTSILKFEEKHRGPHHTNGVHKTVTFGKNSTKEITPLRSPYKGSILTPRNNYKMSDKKSIDNVEMQSIESLDLTEPKKVAPKPPPVYFQPPLKNLPKDANHVDEKKRTTVIKITEYPTSKRREPAKFDFINRNSETDGFDNELASTLLRSNLKNKTDAFANLSKGMDIKNGSEKPCNGVSGRFNGLHPVPAFIPTGITETQIENVKKSLKTFDKSGSNTVVLKIPKIN